MFDKIINLMGGARWCKGKYVVYSGLDLRLTVLNRRKTLVTFPDAHAQQKRLIPSLIFLSYAPYY